MSARRAWRVLAAVAALALAGCGGNGAKPPADSAATDTSVTPPDAGDAAAGDVPKPGGDAPADGAASGDAAIDLPAEAAAPDAGATGDAPGDSTRPPDAPPPPDAPADAAGDARPDGDGAAAADTAGADRPGASDAASNDARGDGAASDAARCRSSDDCPANESCLLPAGTCVCPAGNLLCGGACVPPSPLHCGSSCLTCPTTANGDAACAGGACTINCRAGYQACTSGCCRAFTVERVDPPVAAGGDSSVAMVFDAAGAPHVAFADPTNYAIIYGTRSGGVWTLE